MGTMVAIIGDDPYNSSNPPSSSVATKTSTELTLDNQHDTLNLTPQPTPDLPLASGCVLADRYMVQDVIGAGGMGSVYRARDMHFPNAVKLVAVKEMISQARDPVVRQTIVSNFEREANILVTLNHTSIPRIFDFFTQNERSYLVEEYIPGRNLETVLNETPSFLPQDQVVGWALELTDVLSFLHAHQPEPIIFRDMKPSNVMVNQENHIFLVDFGIAKIFKSGQRGTMIGTEGYSPPEQYRGEASLQADIYSFGATLHHLLSKRDPRLEPPFTFSERPLSRFNPSVTPEMEAVINTCLSYKPEDRYQNAGQVKEALLKVIHKDLPQAPVYKPEAPAVLAQGMKPLWKFECEDEIRGSPAMNNGLVLVGAYDNNLYAINASNGTFVWKYATEGGIAGKPAIYESTIFLGSEDGRLHAISERSGKVQWMYPTNGPVRSSPRIADGHVFVGSDDCSLHVINLASTRRAWAMDVNAPVRSTPFITRDYIYFGNEAGEMLCVDFRGETRWRHKSKRAVTSSPLVDKGTVYFASLDASFYALDARSGWMIWRYRLGKGSISSPAKSENLVFVGAVDGSIYALDAGNSKVVWQYRTDHQVNGSPVIYKDALYCGSVDGSLYCLDYRTGKLRWRFTTGGPITGTPLVYNDILYVGSTDHCLYALLA